MNILLTGVTGQLGGELLPLLTRRGQVTCIGRRPPVEAVADFRQLDLNDDSAVEAVLNEVEPSLIVNAAAFTAVDLAESDVSAAHDMNAKLPGKLAHWSHLHAANLIHYSTDYVFDGESSHAYKESDATKPQSVYGQSKLQGELAIAHSGCRHIIIRTAWVYSSHGKNFLLSMLQLARKGLDLKIVDDQVGSPTSAHNLAWVTDRVIRAWQSNDAAKMDGIYHYRDAGVMSWFEFARAIFDMAVSQGLLENQPSLAAIAGADFPQAAKRPDHSVLDCQKISRDFGIQPRSFEVALKTVVDELTAA